LPASIAAVGLLVSGTEFLHLSAARQASFCFNFYSVLGTQVNPIKLYAPAQHLVYLLAWLLVTLDVAAESPATQNIAQAASLDTYLYRCSSLELHIDCN